MLNSNDIKIIEDYIRGDLNNSEKINVENRLNEDESFKKTFDDLVITKRAIENYVRTEKIIDKTMSLMRENSKIKREPFYYATQYFNFIKTNKRYYGMGLLIVSLFVFMILIEKDSQFNLEMSKPPTNPSLKMNEYKNHFNDIGLYNEDTITVSLVDPVSSEFNKGNVFINSKDDNRLSGFLYNRDGKKLPIDVDWLDVEKGLLIAIGSDNKKYLLKINK
tara:strand:+ start:238 stop:897 length:660 start_codon:yes stop_codon:yes gene_type:complete